MSLHEYLKKIDRKRCLKCCKFKEKEDLPIIKVPPPTNPRILLISRDPTIDFVPLYKYTKQYNSEKMRLMLFAAAIPRMLIVRITKFLRKEKDEPLLKKAKHLFRLFEIAYWTHLHKCPTDEKNKFAMSCAKGWLKEEINVARKEGVQTIVCLGKDVENWVGKNVCTNNINIINLLHPSGRNLHWNRKEKRYEIKESIENLIKTCQKLERTQLK